MLKVLTLALLLAACGSEQKSGQDDKKASPGDLTGGQAPGETDDHEHALYIQTTAEIPACSAKDEGWLIYVVEESGFKTCHKSAWTVVEIKGKDGKDGTPGAAGTAGKDGKDGSAGTAGAAGVKGADGKPPTEGWIDPLTDLLWVKMMGTHVQSFYCGGGFRLPTNSELVNAAVHGLVAKYPIGNGIDTAYAWTSESGCAAVVQPAAEIAACHGNWPANAYTIYCVKEQP